MTKWSINRDSVPHLVDEVLQRVNTKISSFFNKINLTWWGVKYGKNLKTRGFIKLKRTPKSSITVGDNCKFISKPVYNLIGINRPSTLATLTPEAKIIIGNNTGLSGTVVGAFKSIVIGNNVKCGANTLITDSDWHLEDPRSGVPNEVIIEDNVWLGVNVIVLKGVKVGANTIVGANSVVTKSLPANVIAAGNPCKIIKELV